MERDMIDFVERICNWKDELPQLLENETNQLFNIKWARPNIIGSNLPASAIEFAANHCIRSERSSQIGFLTVYYDASNFPPRKTYKIPLLLSFDAFIIKHYNWAKEYSFKLFFKDNYICERSTILCGQRFKEKKPDYAAGITQPDIFLYIGLPIYEFFSVLVLLDETYLIVKHIIEVDINSTIGLWCHNIVLADNGSDKKNALIEANKFFNNMIRNNRENKHSNEIYEFVSIMTSQQSLYRYFNNWWADNFYYLIYRKIDKSSQNPNFGKEKYEYLVSSLNNGINKLFQEFSMTILDDVLMTLCREIVVWMGEL